MLSVFVTRFYNIIGFSIYNTLETRGKYATPKGTTYQGYIWTRCNWLGIGSRYAVHLYQSIILRDYCNKAEPWHSPTMGIGMRKQIMHSTWCYLNYTICLWGRHSPNNIEAFQVHYSMLHSVSLQYRIFIQYLFCTQYLL